MEYIYVVNDSQIVGNPIPTLGHLAKNGEMKKWFVANQRKLSTASLWTTFRIMWAPPPRGKKKFIASDWVYKVLSRNYWAKKTNLRVTHKQVELLSTSTCHLAHEPIHRRDRKNNFTQHSLIYELDCCKHSKNPLRGRGARLPQGYHRRGGGDHYKPRYYNLSL